MKKSVIFVTLGTSLLVLGGCSKKLGEFSSDYFSTNPTPLETVGEQVPATITGNIPAKFMQKNAQVTATPVLAWEGGSVSGTPVIVQGENVRANGQVVSYKEGGQVVIPFNVAYQPEMASSDLYLDFNVDQKGKLYSLPRVKVGYGVVATSTLANAATVTPAQSASNYERIVQEKYAAEIKFLINQANIRANQTSATDYVDLNKQLQEANKAANREIAGITVNSYASPDGSLEFNTQLAEKRENNTVNYVERQLNKDKITEFGELTSSFTPEDWEGFQNLVEKSNIQDKDLILGVLKMYKDPEERERELRHLASVFDELADQILPALRYSKIIATINVIGKSDAEMAQLFETAPQQLSNDELLYLATLTNDSARKMAIYQKACELYPNDYRNFNNLGMVAYECGNYEAAKAAFAKAARLAPNNKEVEMNLGLCNLLDGNYNKAQEQIGGAAGVPEANDALGVYYLTQGDVTKARAAFGSSKTNNAALAQLLAKDYSAAKATLAAVPNPDATTYYIAALLGARTNNESMVQTNLREAFKLDPSMKARAAKDLEFANYNVAAL